MSEQLKIPENIVNKARELRNIRNWSPEQKQSFFAVVVISLWLLFLVILFFTGNSGRASLMLVLFGIYGMLALSLNLVSGKLGILNFGVVSQVFVGAVVTALLPFYGVPVYLAVVIGALTTAGFSAIIALSSLKLRDDYFAIVTITIGEIFRQFATTERLLRPPDLPASPVISAYPDPFTDLINFLYEGGVLSGLKNTIIYSNRYFLTVGFFAFAGLILIYFASHVIVTSPYGRLMKSIREDEDVVSVYGKRVLFYKVQVYAISGLFSGLAGAFYAWYLTSLGPATWLPTLTYFVWAILVIGGRGNNKGMLLGTLVWITLLTVVRFISDTDNPIYKSLDAFIHIINPYRNKADQVAIELLQLMIAGLTIILFVYFLPKGILRELPFKPEREISPPEKSELKEEAPQ